MPLFTGFGKSRQFTPDVLLEDGADLSQYGLDARVISIPGHSLGSIGILTTGGELFCGDLFENMKGPKLNFIMDDPVAANASLAKLKSLQVKMVYPGHGRPFLMEELIKRSTM
jgi:glyoxylase-like metal-dependent hydrolase (beta-lactamase superfamily II)